MLLDFNGFLDGRYDLAVVFNLFKGIWQSRRQTLNMKIHNYSFTFHV